MQLMNEIDYIFIISYVYIYEIKTFDVIVYETRLTLHAIDE